MRGENSLPLGEMRELEQSFFGSYDCDAIHSTEKNKEVESQASGGMQRPVDFPSVRMNTRLSDVFCGRFRPLYVRCGDLGISPYPVSGKKKLEFESSRVKTFPTRTARPFGAEFGAFRKLERRLPAIARVVRSYGRSNIGGLFPQVFLIDDSIRADDKRHDS